MQTTIIRDSEALPELEHHWRALTQQMEHPEIFDTWEWLQSYIKHMFENNKKLFIVVVTEQNQAVAIAPLCIAEIKLKWRTVKSLQCIISGTGESNSFYLHPQYHYVKLLNQITAALTSHQDEWDWIDLYSFHSRNPVTSLIQQSFAGPSEIFVKQLSLSPFITINYQTEHKFDKSRLKAIERKERKLCREHEVSIKIHAPSNERIWTSFTHLHKQRWPQSLFTEPKIVDFFLDIIPDFYIKDNAHFSYIEIDGNIASVWLTFTYQSKAYMYITATSARYAEYGVGLILTHRVIEYYSQSGVREIDFMAGNQEYKYYWMDNVKINYHIRILNNNAKSKKMLKAYTLLQWNKASITSLFKSTKAD